MGYVTTLIHVAFEVTGWSMERLPELFNLIIDQLVAAEEFIGMVVKS